MIPAIDRALSQHWPTCVRHLCSAAPEPALSLALTTALNLCFRRPLARRQLDFMARRRVRILVPDLSLSFVVSQRRGRLHAEAGGSQGDVSLRGQARDLLRLAAGLCDPDTLFFRRRLLITGDTELGLALKNCLDSLDPSELLPGPLYRLLGHLAESTERGCHHSAGRPDLT